MMDRQRVLLTGFGASALAAAGIALGLGQPVEMNPRSSKPRAITRAYVPPVLAPTSNVTREVARRARQIAAGKLQVSV